MAKARAQKPPEEEEAPQDAPGASEEELEEMPALRPLEVDEGSLKQQSRSGRYEVVILTSEGPWPLRDLRPSVIRAHVNAAEGRQEAGQQFALKLWRFVEQQFPSVIQPDDDLEARLEELQMFATGTGATLIDHHTDLPPVDPYRAWELLFGEACQIIPPPQVNILEAKREGQEQTPAELADQREEAK
tara:strand:+ start:6376 stop:6939 length:564 start_codon:yes stop_codon:yes gene_type:complete